MACLLSVQASFTNTVFHMAALTHEQFSNTIDRELHHEVSHASWVKCAIIDRYVFTRCWERIPNAAVVLDSVSRSALVNTWMIQCNANLHYVSFRNRAYDHRIGSHKYNDLTTVAGSQTIFFRVVHHHVTNLADRTREW